MTTLLDRPSADRSPSPRHTGRILLSLGLCVALGLAIAAAVVLHNVRTGDLERDYLAGGGWPATGQAAYSVDGRTDAVSPGQQPRPIASLAKVMTARLVLSSMPLAREAQGPLLPVAARDVLDYDQRRRDDQSVVAVRTGEALTEREALLALLLPSANNIAVLLARQVSGSVEMFVRAMNAEARRLGMRHTRYTDPSGYDPGTVSTAADQLVLARAMRDDETFGVIVATPSYRLPVAGVVHNTDTLLGHDAFVGTKTGSDDAAGGCFMFRTWRLVHGTVTDVIGVVMGQRGRHAITAGLTAARQLADRIGRPAGA